MPLFSDANVTYSLDNLHGVANFSLESQPMCIYTDSIPSPQRSIIPPRAALDVSRNQLDLTRLAETSQVAPSQSCDLLLSESNYARALILRPRQDFIPLLRPATTWRDNISIWINPCRDISSTMLGIEYACAPYCIERRRISEVFVIRTCSLKCLASPISKSISSILIIFSPRRSRTSHVG